VGAAVRAVIQTREHYAAKLRKLQSATVENIIAMGRTLIEAKEDLEHGEFGGMVADLGWNMTAAQRLMKIARHSLLTKAATLPCLPASREVLYKLTRLPAEELAGALADGRINPGLTMTAANQLLNMGTVREPRILEAVPTAPSAPPQPPLPPPTPEEEGAELAQQVGEALAELGPEGGERRVQSLISNLTTCCAHIQHLDALRDAALWLAGVSLYGPMPERRAAVQVVLDVAHAAKVSLGITETFDATHCGPRQKWMKETRADRVARKMRAQARAKSKWGAPPAGMA
jgi:hypothetical protein